MSKARQLADLLDGTGDVVIGALDNVPAGTSDYNGLTNVPSWSASATTNTTDAGNISSGSLPQARITSTTGSSSNWLTGARTYVTACSNWTACQTANCACACACNC